MVLVKKKGSMKKDKKPKSEKKKKDPRSLKEKFNAARKGLKWKDLKGIGWETLKDLRRSKEMFALVASSFVPGGWVGYAVYRVVKYRNGQPPANDNTEQKKPKPPQKKPPSP